MQTEILKKLETEINEELFKVSSWLVVHKLTLNIEKTNYMTGNKMSELGDNSDCFTDFLTNVICMKFPWKVRINEYTKISNIIFRF